MIRVKHMNRVGEPQSEFHGTVLNGPTTEPEVGGEPTRRK